MCMDLIYADHVSKQFVTNNRENTKYQIITGYYSHWEFIVFHFNSTE